MKSPEVSIIMPVYNAARYLDCSVGSVLAQTSPEWELVCFNDASTDDSSAMLHAFASADARIRVIDSPVNVKQGGGRNRALKEARGQYVMFLDADDGLAPEAVAICLDTARRSNADMVLFDYFRFGGNLPAVPADIVSPLGPDSATLSGDELRRRITLSPTPIWSAMYRRTLITGNDLYFPEQVFYEDNAVALAIQLSASVPVKVNRALYGYRTDNISVTRSLNNYRFFHRLQSAVTLKGHLTRLGLYDRWKTEIDHLILNQYLVHTVYGCIYRFDRLPNKRLHYVTSTVEDVVPGYRHNPLFMKRRFKDRIKLSLHMRFPRTIHALWRLKRTLLGH